MEKLIEFLSFYWREIFDLAVLFISVVLCLIRKRPVVNEMDTIKNDILGVLPVLINSVEKPGEGAQKKSTVMNLVAAYVKKKYKIDLDGSLISYIDNVIENILSTPKKKGE